jgi:acyl-CoA synthetase (AMP-forming)/AMP-acid ligase II
VEAALDRHPAVRQSAVVGVPDGVGGEEVKAFLVCRPGSPVSPQDLAAWCRESLAEFEVPRYLEFCADLPATHTHKIDKRRLREAGSLGGRCYDRREDRWWEPELPAAAALPAAGRA